VINLLSSILNLLFAANCPACGKPADDYRFNPICKTCWYSIDRYTGPGCRVCGLPTPSEYTGLCAACIGDPPPYGKIHFYGLYNGALREAIHLLKFQRIRRLAQPLAGMLLDLPLGQCDAIVPVPLHPKSLRAREFNQTALLGYRLSKALNVPLVLGALNKVKETPLQTEMTGKERRRNLRRAFTASEAVQGKRLLLIDDVITTGATVYECSRVLKKAGAESVEAVALARSMPRY
jgi:ComF family protein